MPWPFRKVITMQWLSSAEAVEHAVHGVVDAFDTGKRSVFEWRRWHQAYRRLKRQHLGRPRRIVRGATLGMSIQLTSHRIARRTPGELTRT